MFASIRCFGLDTRTLRVHVPAFADSYLPGVTVSRKAGQSTYKGPGADALQLTLRFSFRARLMPSVSWLYLLLEIGYVEIISRTQC
jgi:hypothetical protein